MRWNEAHPKGNYGIAYLVLHGFFTLFLNAAVVVGYASTMDGHIRMNL